MRGVAEDVARSLVVRHQERLPGKTVGEWSTVAGSFDTGAAEGQPCPGGWGGQQDDLGFRKHLFLSAWVGTGLSSAQPSPGHKVRETRNPTAEPEGR